MKMIKATSWGDVPPGYTGIAWWPKYHEYDFFVDRYRCRDDGPCIVWSGSSPPNLIRFADEAQEPKISKPIFALSPDTQGITQETFELYYMLKYHKVYDLDMQKDFNKLEKMRESLGL